MAKIVRNEITYYVRRGRHPHYGGWHSLCVRDSVIHYMKGALRERLTESRKPPACTRTTVADYLLVDVAHEVGFDPEDVLEVMSGRPYGY